MKTTLTDDSKRRIPILSTLLGALWLAVALIAQAAQPDPGTGGPPARVQAPAPAPPPCCAVTAIDVRGGVVVAREMATGRTFQFRAPQNLVAQTKGEVKVPIAIANKPAGAVPSVELQAELVAQLHAYIGQYKRVVAPPATSGPPTTNPPSPPGGPPGSPIRIDVSKVAKEIKITDVTRLSADEHDLYVKFAVRIREKRLGVVVQTRDGSAQGKFSLGEVTAQKACIVAPHVPPAPSLTVTDISHIPDLDNSDGGNEARGAAWALQSNFQYDFCVPLYPNVTTADLTAEEAVLYPAKPAPVPNAMRFQVKLSNLSARTVTLRYATADVTAKAGTDYTAVTGTLSIPTLSPMGAISVGLKRRAGEQGDRRFNLNLTNPVNCVLVNSQAKGLIIDYPEER